MPKTIKFHNTPALTREYVNNWLTHARKDKQAQPAQLSLFGETEQEPAADGGNDDANDLPEM